MAPRRPARSPDTGGNAGALPGAEDWYPLSRLGIGGGGGAPPAGGRGGGGGPLSLLGIGGGGGGPLSLFGIGGGGGGPLFLLGIGGGGGGPSLDGIVGGGGTGRELFVGRAGAFGVFGGRGGGGPAAAGGIACEYEFDTFLAGVGRDWPPRGGGAGTGPRAGVDGGTLAPAKGGGTPNFEPESPGSYSSLGVFGGLGGGPGPGFDTEFEAGLRLIGSFTLCANLPASASGGGAANRGGGGPLGGEGSRGETGSC